MDTETLQKLGVIELNDREVVAIHEAPGVDRITRAFGVAIDNEEAQEFIRREYRVFGDKRGPYLVVRLPADMAWPYELHPRYDVLDDDSIVSFNRTVSVKIKPVRWVLQQESGWICWLLEVS